MEKKPFNHTVMTRQQYVAVDAHAEPVCPPTNQTTFLCRCKSNQLKLSRASKGS